MSRAEGSCQIYLRSSTDEQHPESQREACERLARSRGWPDDRVGVVIEKESTRRALPLRDALLKRVHRGEVRAVVVWALSRLARDQVEAFSLVERIELCGAKLYSVQEEWLHMDDPIFRALMLRICAWFGEWDRERIRVGTRAGLDRWRAAHPGQRLGRRPLDDAIVQQILGARDAIEAGQLSRRGIAKMLRCSEAAVRGVLRRQGSNDGAKLGVSVAAPGEDAE